jgi:hypothetical protein
MTLTHSAASSYPANLLGMGIAVEGDEEIPAWWILLGQM